MSQDKTQTVPPKKRETDEAKEYSISDLIKSPMQMFLFCLVVITLLAGLAFTIDGYNIRQWALQNKPPGYQYPQITDAWVTLVAAVFFVTTEIYIFRPAFKPIAKIFCKEQTDMKMHELRVDKMTNTFHKFLYFSFATIWGYIVLKDQEYMPWMLGGSGDYHIGISKKYFPFAERSQDDGLKNYILVTSGFHVAGFVVHLLETRKNDFIEMGLHHIVALYLFGGLYFFNLWEPGSTIAFLHDIADIFVGLSKTFGETKYSNMTAFIFVLCMIVWFWTRLITLPYLMYIVYQSEVKFGNVVKEIFIYLLGCMFCLHCYWFSLFCGMITKFIKTGQAEDTQNKTEKITSKSE